LYLESAKTFGALNIPSAESCSEPSPNKHRCKLHGG